MANKNLALLALSIFYPPLAFADSLATKPVITLGAAKMAIAAVMPSAVKGHPPLVVTVVDDGGQLIYLERGDGAATIGDLTED